MQTLAQLKEQADRETVAKYRIPEARYIALLRVVQERLLEAVEAPSQVWPIQ